MADATELRLITFRVGTESFVLDIMAVRQIIPYAGSTSIPTAPSFIEGIIVLRNEVIPIVDLRDRLYPSLTEREVDPLVLIVHSSAGTIGLKVDEVRHEPGEGQLGAVLAVYGETRGEHVLDH